MIHLDPTPRDTAARLENNRWQFLKQLCIGVGGPFIFNFIFSPFGFNDVADACLVTSLLMSVGMLAYQMFWLVPLWRRAIWFPCTHCGKYLTSHCKWRCGFCNAENEPHDFVWHGSVLGCCRHCPGEPTTVQCPYCAKNIQWGEEPDPHPAVLIGLRPDASGAFDDPAEREAKLADEQAIHAHNMQLLEQEIAMTSAKERRAVVKKRLAQVEGDSDGEQLAIHQLMAELKTAGARNQALRKFEKEHTAQIENDENLSADEKRNCLEELRDTVSEIRSKYL